MPTKVPAKDLSTVPNDNAGGDVKPSPARQATTTWKQREEKKLQENTSWHWIPRIAELCFPQGSQVFWLDQSLAVTLLSISEVSLTRVLKYYTHFATDNPPFITDSWQAYTHSIVVPFQCRRDHPEFWFHFSISWGCVSRLVAHSAFVPAKHVFIYVEKRVHNLELIS